MAENYQIFSHEVFNIPRGAVPIVMPPLTVDPPLHARFRAVFNPFFQPSKVAAMKEAARGLAIELVKRIAAQQSCELVSEFASILPVVMFLSIVDLPQERRREFIEWGDAFSLDNDQAVRQAGLARVLGYLARIINERHANPGNDLLSAIAGWRDNPRFGGEAEVQGMPR